MGTRPRTKEHILEAVGALTGDQLTIILAKGV